MTKKELVEKINKLEKDINTAYKSKDFTDSQRSQLWKTKEKIFTDNCNGFCWIHSKVTKAQLTKLHYELVSMTIKYNIHLYI